ncbi:hypothetical protein ACTXT7_005054 [Hymenolepis weldensis]
MEEEFEDNILPLPFDSRLPESSLKETEVEEKFKRVHFRFTGDCHSIEEHFSLFGDVISMNFTAEWNAVFRRRQDPMGAIAESCGIINYCRIRASQPTSLYAAPFPAPPLTGKTLYSIHPYTCISVVVVVITSWYLPNS